jgi:hypothetical protein
MNNVTVHIKVLRMKAKINLGTTETYRENNDEKNTFVETSARQYRIVDASWLKKYLFLNSITEKNEKVALIKYVYQCDVICHATGALILYMWYITGCVLTSATINICSTIHKIIKKNLKNIHEKWRFYPARHVFVTHITKLSRVKSYQMLINSSHWNYGVSEPSRAL